MVSIARTEFLNRLRIFNLTLQEQHGVLFDRAIHEVEHNERARFLRNGLSIISFNILEDFIKNRIYEVLTFIANTGIDFNSLPEKFQEAITISPLNNIQTLTRRKKNNNEDWKLFIQTETGKITSTANVPFQISLFGFGYDKSNLDTDEVSKFLNIFQIHESFTSIGAITNIIGCALFDPKTFFLNAANRRHNAAHNPNAVSLYGDLENYGIAVKSFALAFDFLIAKAACFIRDQNHQYLNVGRKVQPTDIAIRFIRKQGGFFKEMSATNSRPILNFNTEMAAVNSLITRANYQHEMIVVVDYPNKVHSWYTAL